MNPVVSIPSPVKEVMLRVTNDRVTIQQLPMQEGASVMIGSGANCGIRLNSMRISSIHCLLQLNGGRLVLQDWCSMLGTYVNEERVEEQRELSVGDVIRLGEFAIEVAPAGAKRTLPEPAVAAPQGFPKRAVATPASDTGSTGTKGSAPVSTARAASPAPTPTPTVAVATEVTPTSTPVVPASSSTPVSPRVEAKPVPTKSAAVAPAQRPALPKIVHHGATDPWDQEAVGLLQAELEMLQAELRQRDQELAELRAAGSPSANTAAQYDLNQEQTETLVSRLESLLDELSRSDQRVLALEDLLRAEQERAAAELEERQEVEAWLGGIEQRVSDREAEWTSERVVLQNRLEQLRQDREQLDYQLQQQAGGATEQALVERVQGLRQQLEEAQQRLEETEQARQRLEQQLESVRDRSAEQLSRESIEEAVREERLRLAQERATLSRDRAELARRLAELDRDRSGKVLCEADERFNVLRQSLKETRDKGPEVPVVRKQSLGARLADLWRRLDGPTDTD